MKFQQAMIVFCAVTLLILQQTREAEGVFFLDLLCASRIAALEMQVSQLNANINAVKTNNGGQQQQQTAPGQG